jgi:predicted nucleic acid-binding protein
VADLDIDAALRWFRFGRREQLARRSDEALPFITKPSPGGQALLLDTCVYIDRLRGRLPGNVKALISQRLVNHSTVAIQELMHSIGALDPDDGRTPGAVTQVAALIRSMRRHRIFVPDQDVLGRAAMLGGLLCRLQRHTADNRMRALMDATLFLQARKLGLAVVTRNIGDFDLLLQLFPRTTVHLYRT